MGVGIIYLQKTIKNHSYLYHTWILWVFVLLGSDVTEVPSSLKEFFITTGHLFGMCFTLDSFR